MNTLNVEIKNKDGSIDTVAISSDDKCMVNLPKKYKLVGYAGNKINDIFKASILGSDIGINSNGFVNIILISSVIVLETISHFIFI